MFLILRDNDRVILLSKLKICKHTFMYVILVFNMGFNQIYLAG